MRIVGSETLTRSFVSLWRVTTDGGAPGRGVEIAPYWLDRAEHRISRQD